VGRCSGTKTKHRPSAPAPPLPPSCDWGDLPVLAPNLIPSALIQNNLGLHQGPAGRFQGSLSLR
jgi:hypothetical protein